MILSAIASNMSSGLSGAASKLSGAKQSPALEVLLGKNAHNESIDRHYDQLKSQGTKFTGVRSMVKKGWDNTIAADYKGEGAKRAGVIGARQAAGALASIPLEGAYRYATGSGTFTTKDGERDIAGIPFV